MNEREEKVLIEENGKYQFDFSAAAYVLELHDAVKSTMLSDVDFITGIGQEVVFIEYKNASVEGAANPDAMLKKIKGGNFYEKIARKFYDSLLLFLAKEKDAAALPVVYFLIIEHPALDKRIRRQLTLKIMNQLPFRFQEIHLEREMIRHFETVNLEEWAEQYPQIPITAL